MSPEHKDDFIARGIAAVEAEIDALQAVRVSPAWDDLRAAVRGVLVHIANWQPPAPVAPAAPAAPVVTLVQPAAPAATDTAPPPTAPPIG